MKIKKCYREPSHYILPSRLNVDSNENNAKFYLSLKLLLHTLKSSLLASVVPLHKMFFTVRKGSLYVLNGLHTKNNKMVILRTVLWGTKNGSSMVLL